MKINEEDRCIIQHINKEVEGFFFVLVLCPWILSLPLKDEVMRQEEREEERENRGNETVYRNGGSINLS